MDVETTTGRHVQEVLFQELPEGNDNDQLGGKLPDSVKEARVIHRYRFVRLYPELDCVLPQWCSLHSALAPRRAIRLRTNSQKPDPCCVDQALQDGNAQFARAKKIGGYWFLGTVVSAATRHRGTSSVTQAARGKIQQRVRTRLSEKIVCFAVVVDVRWPT